ncbi:MAG: hypothetical protein O3B31_11545 [Chloroflexi bacterium]|nr:hypothetical protein [Chloroflexota bacterium]
MPDDDAMAGLALSIGSQGDFRPFQTMRAFTEDETSALIARLS